MSGPHWASDAAGRPVWHDEDGEPWATPPGWYVRGAAQARWTPYLGMTGWTVLDEHGNALILTRSDSAADEVRKTCDARNYLADTLAKVRELAANGDWPAVRALLTEADR